MLIQAIVGCVDCTAYVFFLLADLLKSGCSSLKALNLAGATPQPARFWRTSFF